MRRDRTNCDHVTVRWSFFGLRCARSRRLYGQIIFDRAEHVRSCTVAAIGRDLSGQQPAGLTSQHSGYAYRINSRDPFEKK